MAFPTFKNKRFGISWNAGRTSHPAFSPGTAFPEGALIIVLIGTSGGPTFSTSSSGWTEVGEKYNGTNCAGAVYAKVAEGHGNDDLTITTSTSVYSSIMVLVYDNGTAPISLSSSTGFSAAPNSPSHNMGTAKDYMWISAIVIDGTQTTQTPPTNYTKRMFVERTTANPPNLIIADRQLNASSEDPGAWSVTSSDNWVSFTFAFEWNASPTDNYGMKCWDSSGNVRVDSTERITALAHEATATKDNDGNSGSLSWLSGRSTFELGIAKETGGYDTKDAPHRVYRSGTTIYWEARSNPSFNSIDTVVLVFVFE